MSIGKSDLSEILAAKTGITKAKSAEVLNTLIEEIQSSVAAGKSVAIPGFGTFEARKREAREGRNPATGETIKIAAKSVPAFKPGAGFKAAVGGK